MLKRAVMTPYGGVKYHLKEFTRRGPQNSHELFNTVIHHWEMWFKEHLVY